MTWIFYRNSTQLDFKELLKEQYLINFSSFFKFSSAASALFFFLATTINQQENNKMEDFSKFVYKQTEWNVGGASFQKAIKYQKFSRS